MIKSAVDGPPTPVKRQPPDFPRPINPYRPPKPHAIVEKIEAGNLAEEMGSSPATRS